MHIPLFASTCVFLIRNTHPYGVLLAIVPLFMQVRAEPEPWRGHTNTSFNGHTHTCTVDWIMEFIVKPFSSFALLSYLHFTISSLPFFLVKRRGARGNIASSSSAFLLSL